MPFISDELISCGPWQAMERAVARLMIHGFFEDVRLVGRTGDGGADILARRYGKRYIVQVKFRSSGNIDNDVVDEIIEASRRYRSEIPIIATNRFFRTDVYQRQVTLQASGIPLQLWDGAKLKREWGSLPESSSCLKSHRKYQESPIKNIVNCFLAGDNKS